MNLIENLIEIKSGEELVCSPFGQFYDKGRGWGRFWMSMYAGAPYKIERAKESAWKKLHDDLKKAMPELKEQIARYKEGALKGSKNVHLRNKLALWAMALPKHLKPEVFADLRPIANALLLEDTVGYYIPWKDLQTRQDDKMKKWAKRINDSTITVHVLHKAIKAVAKLLEWESPVALETQLWRLGCKKFEDSDPNTMQWHKEQEKTAQQAIEGVVIRGCNDALLPIWVNQIKNFNPLALKEPGECRWESKNRVVLFPHLMPVHQMSRNSHVKRAETEVILFLKSCMRKEKSPVDLESIYFNQQGQLVLIKPMYLKHIDCLQLDQWLYKVCDGNLATYRKLRKESEFWDHPQIRFMKKVVRQALQGNPFDENQVSIWDQIDDPSFIPKMRLLHQEILVQMQQPGAPFAIAQRYGVKL